MSLRATRFGAGRNGGQIEYGGDLPAPVTSYASAAPTTPMQSGLQVPATTVVNKSAVVQRFERRGGHRFFYSHGAVPMPPALPRPGVGVGGVESSLFQPYNVNLFDWMINASWFEAGYNGHNLGLSTRVSQLETNNTGGPGKSRSTARPLLTRVQTVERARVLVRTYQTRSAKS